MLEAQQCIHVAVREVMHHLPDGPASLTIRGVELIFAEAAHRSPQVGRRGGNGADPFLPAIVSDLPGERERTDGVAQVESWCRGGHTGSPVQCRSRQSDRSTMIPGTPARNPSHLPAALPECR